MRKARKHCSNDLHESAHEHLCTHISWSLKILLFSIFKTTKWDLHALTFVCSQYHKQIPAFVLISKMKKLFVFVLAVCFDLIACFNRDSFNVHEVNVYLSIESGILSSHGDRVSFGCSHSLLTRFTGWYEIFKLLKDL